jgi:hypothetical protein
LIAAPVAAAAGEPEQVALDFVSASQSLDYDLFCSTLSRRILAEVSAGEDCATALREGDAQERERALDEPAVRDIQDVWQASFWVAFEDGGSHACFVRKGYPAVKLARVVEQVIRKELGRRVDVRLGRGPAAAKGTPAGVVILDPRLATCSRLTLYVETATGKILRLRGNSLEEKVRIDQVAIGVPEPVKKEKPPEIEAYAVAHVAYGPEVAYVRLYAIAHPENVVTLRLVLEDGLYKVDDLLRSLIGG